LLFRQTLYSGGKIRNTYKLSQANLKRAESGVETLRHEIEYETTKNFFELLALKKKEKVLTNALVELDKAARQAAGEHELLKVNQMAGDVRERLSQLKSDRDQTRFRYLQSMGLELFGAADVDGELDVSTPPEELQLALVRAKQNRTDLKATEIQEEVDQLSVELSRAERYPVFLLGGGYEMRNNEFPVNETNWHAALSMNIPVFDGFSGYARVKESRYRAEQGRLKRVNLEDQVEGDVRSAYSEVTHWKQEMDARRLSVDSFNKMRPHYFGPGKAGKSRAERMDFLMWDTNAQCHFIEARCAYAVARARLAQATGQSLTDQP
jgi:outer membrane protein TolC